ncbi:MAG TPA: hypothetical protein VGN81_05635, partial [Pseudonocardiaceae bacterium]
MRTVEIRERVVQAISDAKALENLLVGVLADIDGEGDAIQVPRQGRWTAEMTKALYDRASHLVGVRALFEITAEHPNEAVTFTELIRRSGLDERRQRNEHARLSRIAAELFGEKRWPLEAWQSGTPNADGKSEM